MSRPAGYLLPKTHIDPEAVIAEVARGFGLSKLDLIERSRARHICVARATAMAVIREVTDLSFPAIGDVFDRDHTTVMHHVERVMKDPRLSEAVRLVIDELNPPPQLFAVPEAL